MPLQAVRAATLYVQPISKAIHQLKYNNGFALAEPLSQIMLQGWQTWAPCFAVDLALAVPLHPQRERERGYNQSQKLLDKLGQHLNWPTDMQALQRIRRTRPQVELSASDRQRNVKDAFSATPQRVAQRHILLVDDVCTTGATLAAAAEALLAAGAASVSAYCLARASESNQKEVTWNYPSTFTTSN